MKKESIIMPRLSLPAGRPARPSLRREPERGQMLVIFALALIAMVGMVGLIVDGGDTFLQRRDQQNVADAAAMAAGYAYVNSQDETAAAQAVATANGYQNGVNNTTITVTILSDSIKVDVSRPHRNYFSGVMGFASWPVTTTASVAAGVPNGAFGAMPLIFNEKAFDNPTNRNANTPAHFNEPPPAQNPNPDVPVSDFAFNWTVFCTANGNPCNADSNVVDNLILQDGTSTTINKDDPIAPLNAGAHTTLFSDLAGVIGKPYPVAIVDDQGKMVGWAWFHLTGSVGGSTKQISGWFDQKVNPAPMKIVQGHANADGVWGAYAVDLIN
jgi:Flp pilus assembly protein TadG